MQVAVFVLLLFWDLVLVIVVVAVVVVICILCAQRSVCLSARNKGDSSTRGPVTGVPRWDSEERSMPFR